MFQKLKKKIRIFSLKVIKSKWWMVLFISLTIAGIILPQTASANFWEELGIWGRALTDLRPSDLLTGLGELGVSIAKTLAWAAFYLARGFFSLVGDLFETVLGSDFINRSIIDEPTTKLGWQIVRSFANMLIVLAFVVVGVATILRLREYEAQKLLPTLIIVAILINFSPLICGIIIDSANVTMNYFLKDGGDISGGIVNSFKNTLYGTNIVGLTLETYMQDLLHGKWMEYVLLSSLLALFSVVGAIALLNLSILFIVRSVLLTVLVVLSPIAFASYAVPALKKQIWDKWWHEFLSWTFTGVAGLFFVYLASKMLTGLASSLKPTTPTSEIQMIAYGVVVPAIFLIIAGKVAKSTSAMGAGAVMGLASGAAGFVAGKAKAIGMGAAGKVGARIRDSKAGAWVGDKWGAVKESIPILGAKKGTTAGLRAQRRQEAQKRLGSLGDEQLGKVAGSRTESRVERAAATEELAKRGALDKIPPNRYQNAIANATAYGVPRSTLAKVDPSLARGSKEHIEKVTAQKRETLIAGGYSPQRADAELRSKGMKVEIQEETDQMARKEAYQKLDVPAIRGLSMPNLNIEFVENTSNKKLNKGLEEMSKDKLEHLQTKVRDEIQAKLKAMSAGPEKDKLEEKLRTIMGY